MCRPLRHDHGGARPSRRRQAPGACPAAPESPTPQTDAETRPRGRKASCARTGASPPRSRSAPLPASAAASASAPGMPPRRSERPGRPRSRRDRRNRRGNLQLTARPTRNRTRRKPRCPVQAFQYSSSCLVPAATALSISGWNSGCSRASRSITASTLSASDANSGPA